MDHDVDGQLGEELLRVVTHSKEATKSDLAVLIGYVQASHLGLQGLGSTQCFGMIYLLVFDDFPNCSFVEVVDGCLRDDFLVRR